MFTIELDGGGAVALTDDDAVKFIKRLVAENAKLRTALEWIITRAQQTASIEGHGTTVSEYFRLYLYLPVRLEKTEFETLQTALDTEQPAPAGEKV